MTPKHLPNLLSFSRIALTPVFLYFLLFSNFEHAKVTAAIIFTIASITDAFDGQLARRYNLVTRLGVFLDPLADKFLVLSAFFSFAILGDVHLWMVILISFRDILVTLLRTIMELKGITMITSKAGKLKTLLQIIIINVIFIYLVLKGYGLTEYSRLFVEFEVINGLMLITTIVTVYTGLHYFYYNHENLKTMLMKK